MSYYESEVPDNLELNSEYTSREVHLFMIENRDVMILSESVHLNYNDTNLKYKVVDIKENFIHKQTDNGYRTHLIPNRKTRIFQIKRVN